MFHRDPMVDVDNGGLPPRTMWEVYDGIKKSPEASRNGTIDLVNMMDEEFRDKPRREQVLELVSNIDGYNVTQKDIAKLMNVSESLVTRIKHYYQEPQQRVKAGWKAKSYWSSLLCSDQLHPR